MHKLIMVWLMGVTVLAMSPFDTGRAQSADEQAAGAEARIAQIQAILDDEDEGLADDEFNDGQDEPDSQGDIGGLGDPEDPDDPSDETGSSAEWGTPT